MKPIKLEYKTYEELKEELGNEYDTAMYEINISALKEIERQNHIIKILEKYVINERTGEYGDTLEEAKEYLEHLKSKGE